MKPFGFCKIPIGALLAWGSAAALSGQTAPAPSVPPSADQGAQSQTNAPDKSNTIQLNPLIVTGVFEGIDLQQATVAVSTLSQYEMSLQIPTSSFSLLENIPGVFVDSSNGEVRNIVYSRGLASGGGDIGGGAFSAFEEDGLPVNGSNYDIYADFLLRTDLTVDHVEALRGGTATITGPNAPGGIFNYISKTGGDVPSAAIAVSHGLQGDGTLPYERADVDVGGALAPGGWYYNIGGFYHHDDGTEDAGYPQDFGGQLKANVLKKFAGGSSLEVYVKWLDDHNAYNALLPAVDFASPRLAPGWSNTSNGQMPSTSFQYQKGPGTWGTFDSGNVTYNKVYSVGVKGDFDLGAGWKVDNNLRYSDSSSIYNSGQASVVNALNDAEGYLFMGLSGKAGTYTMTDPANGTSAVVNSTGSVDTVVSDNLPTAGGVPQSILLQAATIASDRVNMWQDQLAISKQVGPMSLTLGGYYEYADIQHSTTFAGFGFSTYTPGPTMLNISLLNTAGQTIQVTDPSGFGAPSALAAKATSGSWEQGSVFFGDRWVIIPRWTLDWGVRYDSYDVDTWNRSGTASVTDSTSTNLYSDSYTVPTGIVNLQRNFDTWSWSGALSHDFNSNNSIYARYTVGKSSPDYGFYSNLSNATTNALMPTVAQTDTQLELGYKLALPRVSLMVTPYYSLLQSVAGTELTNTGGMVYTAFTPNNKNRVEGVEIDANTRLGAGFDLGAAVTWQHAIELSSYSWTQPNGPGPLSSAVLVDTDAGNEEGMIPNVLATVTPSYTRGRFTAQVQWEYVGARAANNNQAFNLPAYNETNLTLEWRFNHHLSVDFVIDNVFDNEGITEWQAPGDVAARSNVANVTPASIAANPGAVFGVLEIPATAYFVKLNYTF